MLVATTQLERRLRLHGLDARVERGQRDRRGARRCRRSSADQLVLGVDRIQRDDDRAELPQRELRDHPLRAGGQDAPPRGRRGGRPARQARRRTRQTDRRAPSRSGGGP